MLLHFILLLISMILPYKTDYRKESSELNSWTLRITFQGLRIWDHTGIPSYILMFTWNIHFRRHAKFVSDIFLHVFRFVSVWLLSVILKAISAQTLGQSMTCWVNFGSHFNCPKYSQVSDKTIENTINKFTRIIYVKYHLKSIPLSAFVCLKPVSTHSFIILTFYKMPVLSVCTCTR